MGLAIFDVCDTLYDANTTVGFLHFLAEGGNGRVARSVARWTRRNHPLFWVGAIWHRMFGHDLARRQLIESLAGSRYEDIRAAADRYVETVLSERENRALLARLEEHQRLGDTVWLASNSIEPVVSAIANSLGALSASSTLDVKEGICTGTLATDLTGAKSGAISDALGASRQTVTIYTDNRTDLDLIALADRAVIVIPKGRPFRKWAGENHEYIQL